MCPLAARAIVGVSFKFFFSKCLTTIGYYAHCCPMPSKAVIVQSSKRRFVVEKISTVQWPGPARYRAKPSLVAAKNGRLSRPLLRFEIAEVMQSLHRTLARMTKT